MSKLKGADAINYCLTTLDEINSEIAGLVNMETFNALTEAWEYLKKIQWHPTNELPIFPKGKKFIEILVKYASGKHGIWIWYGTEREVENEFTLSNIIEWMYIPE